VISYRATPGVPRDLARLVARLPLAERHRRGAPRGTLSGSRVLASCWNTAPGLRWFRDRTAPDALARDRGISRATVYRDLDEIVGVLAEQARTRARPWNGPRPRACRT
jgi:hypothetical protein